MTLRRNKPLKAKPVPGAPWGSTLRRESAKRKAERAERAAVREETLKAAGYRCAGQALVPHVRCAGPLDVDEITPRGVKPGAHLDRAETQVLCRAHHEWKHANPAAAAEVGLRRWAWQSTTEPKE